MKTAMLWTGGKDSALALHEMDGKVSCLVTFAPRNPNFLAHPISFIQRQARSLELPHHLVFVEEPFDIGYEKALQGLRDERGIDTVVTGDIAEVGGAPNWIRERCRPLGIKVLTPIWGRDRASLLRDILARKLAVIFSCVKSPWFDGKWVGRPLNELAITELWQLRERTGLDLCGEEGEYHTLVTDGQLFKRRIVLGATSVRASSGMFYLEIGGAD
jgi:uncharacterized protein (TIGR00290 family)